MTERIKELWEQSTGAAVPAEGFYSSASKYNIEKFAELIIQECIEQIWYTREDGINGNVSEVIKERITKHFRS